MKDNIKKIFVFLSFLLLFVSFVNKYLSVKLWDYDFFWHLATGKYIVENNALPQEDPFSFVNNLEENKNLHPAREQMVLKQYWLAQVIFYKIYNAFGDKGIIISRSSMLFATILLVFWWFRKQKVSFYITYPFVFFIFLHSLAFTGERPVLFTILFIVITFFILDDFKQRKGKSIFLLIPLMLVWANLHGGFVLGIFMILAWMAGETFNFIFKREERDKKALIILYSVGLISIAVSAINPNMFSAFSTFSEKSKLFQSSVQEYMSPFTLYKNRVRAIDVEYIILILLLPVISILRNKKVDIVYYLLLCGLLYASATALRLVIYYVSISSIILGREFYYIFEEYLKKTKFNKARFEFVALFLLFSSSLAFAGGYLDFEKITFKKAVITSVPKGATDFIKSNKIEGNMFNDMGFGGYLIWELYPWKKVFIDTRQLNYTVLTEFSWIILSVESIQNSELPEGKKPLWKRLLDHYEIDIIIIDTVGIMGQVRPLMFSLLKSDEWVPVYIDIMSVVFVRDNDANREIVNKHKILDDMVYNAVLLRLTNYAGMDKRNPRLLISIGDVFYEMGKYEDALTAYEYADKRKPNDKFIKYKIEKIKQEMHS